MRRLLAILAVVAAAGAAAVAGCGGGGDGAPHYTVELDNAFGLTTGSDVKVAGVRAGSITSMRLDRHTKRALVGIRIDRTGFGSLRADVRCTVRPQSLLGEYYVDCLPGTSPREVPRGATIPVERTASTVPPDLVLNVMRLPYRERLRLIVDELGAGVAGSAPRLNAAIRRAVPAIGQTDRVLRTLGAQDRQLRGLLRDADTVTSALAGNREGIGRWIREARDTTVAAARRRDDLASGLHRLPAFLAEVTPSMRALGRLARDGAPSLRRLSASAPRLTEFLRLGREVSEAGLPATKALGTTARTGRPAVRTASPSVAELRRSAAGLPEVARNLSLIGAELDSRDKAVEAHPLSPGGKGYTALENVMNYIFNQVLAINVYDAESHILKGAPFINDCSPYTDAEGLKGKEKCRTWVGPNQPGINFPDGTASQAEARAVARRLRAATPRGPAGGAEPLRAPTQLGTLPAPAAQPAPRAPVPSAEPPALLPKLPDLPPVPGVPTPPPVKQSVLDYLLGS